MSTNRPTIDSLTSNQLETLLRERQQARASLAGTAARLRQVSGERDQLRAERDEARSLAVVLGDKLAEATADLAGVGEELNDALNHNDDTCSAVAERDRLARELAALRAATPDRGYCPECGRGDCAPGHAEWQQQYRRAERAETKRDRLAAALTEILETFWAVKEHSGDVIGAQSSMISPDDFARWRAALDAAPAAATVPRTAPPPSAFRKFVTWAPGCDTGRHTYHPGLTCEETDEQIAADCAYFARMISARAAAMPRTPFPETLRPATGCTCPTGVITTDHILSPAQAEALRTAFPGARLDGRVEFTFGGHTWRYQPTADAGRCCVCGDTTVSYRNYREQPFCYLCANCQCGKSPCIRTTTED